MILGVWVNNYGPFSREMEMDYAVNMNSKRFSESVYSDSGINAVKACALFGANNVGKTYFLEAIKTIIMAINKEDISKRINANLIEKEKGKYISTFGISFLVDSGAYAFEFKYNSEENHKGFIYERLMELNFLSQDNLFNKIRKGKVIYEKKEGEIKAPFKGDKSLAMGLKEASKKYLSILEIKASNHPEIKKYQKALKELASSVIFYKPYENSVEDAFLDLVNEYKLHPGNRKEISELIKDADSEIIDYKYIENSSLPNELYSLYSYHKGYSGPSYLIDSRGTIQIGNLAARIVEALKYNKTLIVDGIEDGLHQRVTRAFISMFLNGANEKGQLIFTSGDTSLLDTQRLFRKDQIWFLMNEDDIRYLYALSDFDSNKDGVRETDNIEKMYRCNHLGAVPHPEFFEVMLEIESERRKKAKSK